jgi:DNA (cytosine-5)-methyltransferase 1
MGRALIRASGRSSSGMSLAWLQWNRYSFTLVKQEIADSGTIHPDGHRYIHPIEAKRIGSFPDQYELLGNRKEALARIGNSVPPLLMRAIARHVRGLLPKQPGEDEP